MTDHNTDRDSVLSTPNERLVYEIDVDQRPSDAVVRAVSTVLDTPVLELDPLYYTIDPEQLDGVVTTRTDGHKTDGPSLSFSFTGCQVTVDQYTVTVRVQTDVE